MPGPLDIRFEVEGIPPSKGSLSGFPIDRGACPDCRDKRPCRRTRHPGRTCFGGRIVGVSLTDQGGSELKAWEQLTFVRSLSARNAAAARPIARPGACEVMIGFIMPRPAGHWSPDGAGKLTADGRARDLPSVKPDVDKLSRALIDGLREVVTEDDAQIVVLQAGEVYAPWRGWTGAIVRARQVSTPPQWLIDELVHHGRWTPPAQRELL